MTAIIKRSHESSRNNSLYETNEKSLLNDIEIEKTKLKLGHVQNEIISEGCCIKAFSILLP